MEGKSSSSAFSSVVDDLSRRGWSIVDMDQLKALIVEISSSVGGDGQSRAVVDSVEAELLNMDIRFIGAKSLPDPIQLRRCSHLQGPKVLQISSVRDITRSSTEDFSGGSGGRRLLRLNLTDGQTEICALEYSHVPSIPDDVVPGTKVRLENKAVVHNGLVCLTPKVVTVLGGVVQSLYEEWQMRKKYSAFSRSFGRKSQESGAGSCPPAFEDLRIGIGSHLRDYCKAESRSIRPTAAESTEKFTGAERDRTTDIKQDSKDSNQRMRRDALDSIPKASVKEKIDEKPSSSETRPRQVVETVPLQNQAAAQVLLQKMRQPSSNERQYRGRGHRGKGRKEEQSEVFTLDEWEKRNVGAVPPKTDHMNDTTHDEDLAWQLQNQFDLEDYHEPEAHGTGADDIRMSMFTFERIDSNIGRERGRGRGRGRRRGRGRF